MQEYKITLYKINSDGSTEYATQCYCDTQTECIVMYDIIERGLKGYYILQAYNTKTHTLFKDSTVNREFN